MQRMPQVVPTPEEIAASSERVRQKLSVFIPPNAQRLAAAAAAVWQPASGVLKGRCNGPTCLSPQAHTTRAPNPPVSHANRLAR